MYNPHNAVPYTYRQFFEEAMALLPNLRFVPQGHVPVDEIAEQAALSAFLTDRPAPVVKSVLQSVRRYGPEVIFKP